MTTDINITVVLGAFAGMIAGFYGIAKVMLSQAARDRDADRLERQELSKAIKDMAGATGRVADASMKGAQEAEARNGHLAELSLQGNQLICEVLETNRGIKKTLDTSVIELKKTDKARQKAVRKVKKDLEA